MKNAIVTFLFLSVLMSSKAQVNDFGAWIGVVADKKITKPFHLSFREEVRMNENFSHISAVFSQIGVNYKINKHFKIKVAYRYAFKISYQNYENRHRYQIDLSYKKKIKPFVVQYRTRFQSGYKTLVNSENRLTPTNYWRNKLTIKWDIDKKIEPYFGIEFYHGLNYNTNFFNSFRYFNGINIDLKKKKNLKIGYLYQKKIAVWDSWNEHNLIVSYAITL